MPAGEQYSCDNSGNRVPPDTNMTDPVAASGLTLAMATSGNDYSQALVAGQMYAITFIATAGKVMFISATGLTSTAANIEWLLMAGFTLAFLRPLGQTQVSFDMVGASKQALLRTLPSKKT